MKRCCTCHKHRLESFFSKARNRKDGLYQQCKACNKKASQKYYKENRDKILVSVKAYSKRPIVAARIHKYCKQYYVKHRVEQLAAAKQWRRDNLERRRLYIQEWNKKNRKKVRAYQKAYKIRRYGTNPELTERGWQILLSVFRGCCAYCKRKLSKLEQDHVLALSRKGRHAIGNVVPACRSCNATKGQGDAPLFWWKTA